MRAPVAQGDAEALGVSEDDVRAHLAGRSQDRESEQVGGDRDQRARALRLRNKIAKVMDRACFVGCLHERAEHTVAELCAAPVADDQLDSQRFGARGKNIDGLRKT